MSSCYSMTRYWIGLACLIFILLIQIMLISGTEFLYICSKTNFCKVYFSGGVTAIWIVIDQTGQNVTLGALR